MCKWIFACLREREREQREKNLFNLWFSLAAFHSKLFYLSMASRLMVLYFPKLYWVEVIYVILPVSVFCLSKPERRENINMHRGNGNRCLTLKGIYDMWPSPHYSAFYLLTVIFHMSWNSSGKKKCLQETSAILVEFSKLSAWPLSLQWIRDSIQNSDQKGTTWSNSGSSHLHRNSWDGCRGILSF